MFPLSFPLRILKRYATTGDTVLDPFAGRGTTMYAARLQGLGAYGLDSNAVAVAISEGKLANTTAEQIVGAAKRILRAVTTPQQKPTGEFWDLAFDATVLDELSRIREGLIRDCRSDARKALRAIILGALHGPTGKSIQSYFSNQCPRTYAPKPRYALGFWRERKLTPPRIDVVTLIQRRADRFYSEEKRRSAGRVLLADSRNRQSFEIVNPKASWIITSPPYYGMSTYIPDQWLRNWFVGGEAAVSYSSSSQLRHSSQTDFAEDLKIVWLNCASVSKRDCRLIIRFGAINDREVDALGILKKSLADTEWRITKSNDAGSAAHGRRQANHFVSAADAITEYDVWTTRQ